MLKIEDNNNFKQSLLCLFYIAKLSFIKGAICKKNVEIFNQIYQEKHNKY